MKMEETQPLACTPMAKTGHDSPVAYRERKAANNQPHDGRGFIDKLSLNRGGVSEATPEAESASGSNAYCGVTFSACGPFCP